MKDNIPEQGFIMPDTADIYEHIFNAVVDIIIIAEADTRKIFLANRNACRVLGYTEEEICSLTIDNIHPRESMEYVLDSFHRLAEKTTELVKDIPVLTKGGMVFFADITASLIRMEGKKLLLGVFRDVTERKKVENELKQIKFAIDASSDAIAMATAEGVHFYQNEAFTRLFGVTIAEVLERHPVAAYKDKQVGKEVFGVIMSGKSWQGEVEMITRDGRCLNIFLRADAVKDEQGKVIAILGVHTDMTKYRKTEAEKRKLEEMLLHSQKLESVGRLAGGVAHDFNNLLTAILGNSEMVMKSISPEEKNYQRLATVRKAALGAADLTRQLLAFSRKQMIEPKVVDLNELIEHISKVLLTLTGESVLFEKSLSGGLYPIKTDPGQVEQILINLAANARDAMPDGGRLLLKTANIYLDEKYCETHINCTPGHYVMLAVSDNGRGMDRETLSHVFEPFYTTKEKGKGTGLGLATVYGIVKQNGGEIEVYSELNEGTTFKIYFPRSVEDKSPLQALEDEKNLPGGGETILLVEDNFAVLEFTRDSLDMLGYHVISAESGEEALRVSSAYNGAIDLLMADVVLPGMNGRATAEAVMAERPSIKVLYHSGYTAEVIDRHGILEQGLYFISKPFTAQALAKKVREVLDG